jgi:adenylate cyclase
MSARLTADRTASRAGTTIDRIQEMVTLGILDQKDDGFDDADVGRAVVVEALVSEGIALADLAATVKSGKLSLGWFGGILPPVPEVDKRTFRKAIEDAGLPTDLVEQLYTLWGIAVPPADELIRADDAAIVGHVGRVFKAFGEDPRLLLASARHFGDNMRRVAQSQMDFFRRELIESRLASGASLHDVLATLNPFITDISRPAVDDLIRWLFRRHIDTFNIQLLVQLIESELEEAGIEVARVERPPAIAFLDLSGFTRLTEEGGDQEAVGLATALTDLVRTLPARYGGTAVKLLGDGVMLYFPDPVAAVRCALRLVAEAEERGLPAARVGIHAGPVVFREGDYYGRTVNVAARITDYARPREVLVSDALHPESLATVEGFDLDEIGPVALKGLSDRIPLYSVHRSHTSSGEPG